MKTNFATETMKAITEINQDIARAKVLRRELAMLRSAQPHLRGIPALHNLTRIAEREDELNTLAFLIEHADRVGVEEVVRCNAMAAMEGAL